MLTCLHNAKVFASRRILILISTSNSLKYTFNSIFVIPLSSNAIFKGSFSLLRKKGFPSQAIKTSDEQRSDYLALRPSRVEQFLQSDFGTKNKLFLFGLKCFEILIVELL